MWEALDKAALYGLDNLTAHRRRQPARAVGPHRARVGPGRLPAARGVVRLPRRGDRRSRPAADRRRHGARRALQLPTVILARTVKGKGVPEVEDTPGWHGKPLETSAGRRRDRGARRRDGPPGGDAAAPVAAGGGARAAAARRHAAQVRDGHEGRDEGRLRRRARRARRAPRGGGHRRRGRQLDLHRQVQGGVPRPLLPDVHQRAADGRDGRGHERARLRAVRGHLRRLLHARLRLHPHGGGLAGGHPPVRLARRHGDRPGRPLADGPRGPRRDARRARVDGALPERRHVGRRAHGDHGRPDAASATCAPPAAPTRCCTDRTRLPGRRLQGRCASPTTTRCCSPARA